MAEKAIRQQSKTSGQESLRPRARILRTFGDELISSERVAITELVKNAYDADATRVLIRFQAPLTPGEGRIEILDNGHGMSRDVVRSVWLEPATLFRRQTTRSEKLGRRVLGEKGIGRFAASRLAETLEVVTRRGGTGTEVRAFFDWKQFDDPRKYLDEIVVPWEEVTAKEIAPGGSMAALYEKNGSQKGAEFSHGTILRMEHLRSEWKTEHFRELRRSLSRLVSPFVNGNRPGPKDEFRILLDGPAGLGDFSGAVTPPETLKRPRYAIAGSVDTQGYYQLRLTMEGHKEQPLRGRFDIGHDPQSGPFNIDLRVWDRDPASMGELARLYGSTLSVVRNDLDESAGVSIYRDGFRVLPYGEPQQDWLRLDLRRVQNPTMRLSNNQIIGYVAISAESNPLLRDQTNREGLMEGPGLDDLRELVMRVIAELEKRRYAVRHAKPDEVEKSRQPPGLFAEFDLSSIRDAIKERHGDDRELLVAVDQKETDIERGVEQVQEVLARYRRLATLGQLVDRILHDGRAPLSKLGNEAELALRDIKRSKNGTLEAKLKARLSDVLKEKDNLAGLFRKIEPFGGRKRGRPTSVALEAMISDAFAVMETEVHEVGARVSLPRTKTLITADQAEIEQVFVNLIQNSLYWLRKAPKGRRQIAVQVLRKPNKTVEILFSDSGPGVDAEFRERIFEPYFSTKPDGVGLGLTIVGEIVSDYYSGDAELVDKGLLQGATFRLTLRRRV